MNIIDVRNIPVLPSDTRWEICRTIPVEARRRVSIRSGEVLTRRQGICFHHTAVRGGFAPWGRDLPSVMHQAMITGQVEASDLLRAARFAGTCVPKGAQYPVKGVPYHAVSSRGVLHKLLDFGVYSHHGNSANRGFIGYAWDGDSRYEDFDARHHEEAICHLMAEGRASGIFGEHIEFTVHAAWTNKPFDPGKKFTTFLLDLASRTESVVNLTFRDANGRCIADIVSK